MEGYAWSAEQNSCIGDCSADPLSNGTNLGGYCACIDSAYWDSATMSCTVLDCTMDPNSDGTPAASNAEGQTTSCACNDKFVWEPVNKKCEIDCTTVGTLTTNEKLAVSQCGCQDGSYWSSSAL